LHANTCPEGSDGYQPCTSRGSQSPAPRCSSSPASSASSTPIADRVESAYGRQVRVFALDVRERENPLYALDDLPTKALSELRGVLLQEHEDRVRDWTRLAGGGWHRRLARFGCTRASDGSTIDGRGRNKGLRWGGRGGKATSPTPDTAAPVRAHEARHRLTKRCPDPRHRRRQQSSTNPCCRLPKQPMRPEACRPRGRGWQASLRGAPLPSLPGRTLLGGAGPNLASASAMNMSVTGSQTNHHAFLSGVVVQEQVGRIYEGRVRSEVFAPRRSRTNGGP